MKRRAFVGALLAAPVAAVAALQLRPWIGLVRFPPIARRVGTVYPIYPGRLYPVAVTDSEINRIWRKVQADLGADFDYMADEWEELVKR